MPVTKDYVDPDVLRNIVVNATEERRGILAAAIIHCGTDWRYVADYLRMSRDTMARFLFGAYTVGPSSETFAKIEYFTDHRNAVIKGIKSKRQPDEVVFKEKERRYLEKLAAEIEEEKKKRKRKKK